MHYEADEGGVIVKTEAFNLARTVECGQFFGYRREKDGYVVISSQRSAFVSQDGDGAVRFHNVSLDEFRGFWMRFFDLERDYKTITAEMSAKDPVLKKAIEFAPGIRLLNQDPWECLLGFVISQNNRIPMIMKVVQNISEKFGKCISDDCYALPGPEVLEKIPEYEIKECKAGFRARYILDAAHNAAVNRALLFDGGAPTDTLRKRLMGIKGVGVKVADCVLLFAMGRWEVFPTDVWILRAIRRLYFDGADISPKEIQAFAHERFGSYAGYAQQFLYHYMRTGSDSLDELD